MSAVFETPRALTALDQESPFGFTIWLSGSWGIESRPQLVRVLAGTPRYSKNVTLDCRRVTLIDSSTMHAMTTFADDCANREVACTFACDSDPVGRLITVARLERLTVARRPLSHRAADQR